MRIALLISGRAARYDVCLLPFLQYNSRRINIDIFMSINDENEDCNYYNIMKEKLKPWLRNCIIKKYIIPQETVLLFNPNESTGFNKIQVNLQKINNKFLPYNCLSMYYNDNNSFNMACKYAEENNFEYDVFLKYRSDIININIPYFSKVNNTEYKLHCVTPICNLLSNGIFRKPIVSDAFAWGNKNTMDIYCNTYNYVLNKIKEHNGKYYVAFECSLTDNIYENSLPISYYNIPYRLDKNRRMFDNVHEDSRKLMPNQEYFLKITDNISIKYIKAEKQE